MEKINYHFDKSKTMNVVIPIIPNHEGNPFWIREIRISKYCPKCGGERGKPYKVRSYDGSKSIVCDGWKNPCGHIDLYKDVVAESRQFGLLVSENEKIK